MMTLILATFLTAAPKPATTAQFRPCVWPNTCKTAPVISQFTTCVWPNRCTKAPAPVVAQFTTCVWPNRCTKARIAL